MSDPEVKRRSSIALSHCLAASAVLHLLLGLPFIVHAFAEPPDEPPVLVVELQGAVSDIQTEQKVMQDTKGIAQQPQQPPISGTDSAVDHQLSEDHPMAVEENVQQQDGAPSKSEPEISETRQSIAGSNNVLGAAEKQNAQTIRTNSQTEAERLREYAKLLSKKVRANLVNPGSGHASSATVSFFILSDGRIRPESLKIVASSGQSRVDASALQTIRASVPFDPPPKEMGVTIVVDFSRKG